jgi:hypothetical protein
MTKLANVLLVFLAAVAFIAVPLTASAKIKDNPNSGFCKSGKHVTNTAKCKENGGKL